ncbi:MAG: PAS domain S-box protein [bacterium]|nr:PAS domain S-box protein [bacterium]
MKDKNEFNPQDLRKSKETVQALLAATSDSALIVDAASRTILAANKSFASRINMNPGEIVGSQLFEFFPFQSSEFRFHFMKELMENCAPVRFEDEREGKLFDISLFPVMGEDKTIDRVVIFLGDITERAAIFALDIARRKKAEQALLESEESLKALLNATPDAAMLINTEGTIVAVNENAFMLPVKDPRELIGKTPEDIMGTSVFDYISSSIVEIRRNQMYELIKTGDLLRQSVEWKERVFDFLIIPVCDKHGNVSRVAIFVRDITMQRTASDKLERSEKQYRNLVETMNDGLVVFDRNALITYANPRVYDILGTTPEETIGKPISLFTNKLDQAKLDEYIEKTKQTGAQRFELEVTRKTGESLFLIISSRSMYDENDEFIGIFAIATDITARKMAEKALQYRLEFEGIITRISTNFINLHSNEIDTGIYEALKTIGEFNGDDRSYIFQSFEDGDRIINTHEWNTPGTSPLDEKFKEFSRDDVSWLLNILNNFDILHIPDCSELPPEAETEKKLLRTMGIQSLIAVPMISRGELSGFVVFDSVSKKKTWPDQAVSLLKMISVIFVNTIERKQMEEELLNLFMSRLSEREAELLFCMIEGNHSWPEDKRLIGKKMDVVPGTLDRFMARIKEKIGIEDIDKLLKVSRLYFKK